MLDPDPDPNPHKTDADPKHWNELRFTAIITYYCDCKALKIRSHQKGAVYN
jgi:hypothetical protein